MQEERFQRRKTMVGTLVLLAGTAFSILALFWMVDYFVFHAHATPARGPVALFLAFDPDTLQSALGSLAQIIAAVLGIAITVVSIVLQLAATRYTPRIADMFFRDRTNLMVMGFFVVACIDAVWVSLAVSRSYVPDATVLVTVGMVTGSLLLLVPYFGYVFDFLDPERIIARLGDDTLATALGRKRVRRRRARHTLALRQQLVVGGAEQLADIAVNALAQKDKVIASDAIDALCRVVVGYLPGKKNLSAAWFDPAPTVRQNPDFVAMAPSSLETLVRDKAWVEWKILRQLTGVCSEALKAIPDMAHVVAIATRYVGEAGIEAGDGAVVDLTLKFFNTYLRQALNGRDVRAAYNMLHQYRELGASLLRHEDRERVVQLAGYFRYYAQIAHGMGLPFVAETAAYDLCALCEMACVEGSAAHDALLATFLEIDKEAETQAEEKALRGVRKAQIKLATFYLARGLAAEARRIQDDMRGESPERLRSLAQELGGVSSKEFWEIVDRGENFDFLDAARKVELPRFFRGLPGFPG